MKIDNLISLSILCERYKLEDAFFKSLGEYDLVEIVEVNEERFLHLEQISDLERILRFYNDLEINLAGIEVINNLLKKIDSLEKELKVLRES